jgi:CRP-like cAMP-binding protein
VPIRQEDQILELSRESHALRREVSEAAARRERQARETMAAGRHTAEAREAFKVLDIMKIDLIKRVVREREW